jgi:nucleotide-binding universal stress UspA family protein
VSDAPGSLAACEEALLAFFRSDFAGLRVLPRVQLGPAWDGIARTASDDGADLIVMAAGGAPHGPEERALGSRLERVVRTAPCPVLVT